MNLKLCIWGWGIYGKNIYQFMKGRHIYAIIDSNPRLQGTVYQDIPIISFDEYLRSFQDCIIVVSPVEQKAIVDILELHQISYFSQADLPPEIYSTCREDLYQVVEKKLNKKDENYLYGLNLYSLLLYEYFSEKRNYGMKIIPEQKAAEDLVKKIYALMPDCIVNSNVLDKGNVYITSSKYLNDVGLPLGAVDLYDFMYDIQDYYNPHIEQYKDIYCGKRCFIVATGPSLRMEDLDTLLANRELCISMNGIFKAYSQTSWRPNYYLLMDRKGFAEWKEELLYWNKGIPMFVADVCLQNTYDENFQRFHLSELPVTEDRLPKFSDDFSRGSYTGRTVTYNCIQFAAYLGCKEIYLYGMDFTNGKGHFIDDYISSENEKSDIIVRGEKMLKMESAFRAARNFADKADIKIYNASHYSELDVFERIDFDMLFFDNV